MQTIYLITCVGMMGVLLSGGGCLYPNNNTNYKVSLMIEKITKSCKHYFQTCLAITSVFSRNGPDTQD